jgi:hypothetical protein
MKNFKIFLSGLFVLTAVSSFAGEGDRGGNGGDGILCHRNGKDSVVFYDLFEAEHVHGMNLDLPLEVEVLDKVKELINRIRLVDETRADLFDGWLETFYEETRFTDHDLVDVPDTSSGEFPMGCELKQVIIQKEPHFPGEKRYTISKYYWDLMDSNSKAAAIMHELILREAVTKQSQQNSINSRYFNGKVFENKFSVRAYVELMELISFKSFFNAHGFKFYTDRELDFHDENQVKRAALSGEQVARVFNNDYLVSGDIEFFENGSLKKITLELSSDSPSIKFAAPMGEVNIFPCSWRINRFEFNQKAEVVGWTGACAKINHPNLERGRDFEFSRFYSPEGENDYYVLTRKSQSKSYEILIDTDWVKQSGDLRFDLSGRPQPIHLRMMTCESRSYKTNRQYQFSHDPKLGIKELLLTTSVYKNGVWKRKTKKYSVMSYELVQNFWPYSTVFSKRFKYDIKVTLKNGYWYKFGANDNCEYEF